MNVSDKDIDRLFREGNSIDEWVRRSIHNALREHKTANNPIAGWRDGKIVWVQPQEIPVNP
mgnify:CR=1 FL=1